jgi:hypothetical protein
MLLIFMIESRAAAHKECNDAKIRPDATVDCEAVLYPFASACTVRSGDGRQFANVGRVPDLFRATPPVPWEASAQSFSVSTWNSVAESEQNWH